MGDKQNKPIRLQVFMARSGIASRRKCEEFIKDGRVRVNGRTVCKPGTKVRSEDNVTFNGKKIAPVKEKIYIVLNKPTGYLCSNYDPKGRPLALDLLRGRFPYQRLFHVGRLDFFSSGLIFYTNDGEFARVVSHPSSEIEKEYLVVTDREIEERGLKAFLSGVVIEGELYCIKRFSFKNPNSVLIVLHEGKHREIRKIFDYMALRIKKLHRIRIDGVTLKGLSSGSFRTLTSEEIGKLLENRIKKR